MLFARHGLATVVTACVLAPTAAATTMTFDDARVRLGGIPELDIVDAANPVTMTTDVAGNGDFSLAPAQFDFPASTPPPIVPGLGVTVDVIPLADVTGNYSQASGLLTTNTSDFAVAVQLSGSTTASCTISPVPLAFSTQNTTPLAGDPFDPGSLPPLNGAVAAGWPTLPAATGDPGCGIVDTVASGPGGIRLSNGAAAGGPLAPGAPLAPGGPPAPAPPAPPPGSDEPASSRAVKCARRGRYRGRTSQGEPICFNLVRKGKRRSVSVLKFKWTGSCDAGTAEGQPTFRRLKVDRDGDFKTPKLFTDTTFAGRIKGKRARGTLRMRPGRGGCDSGRVRWTARRR